MRGLPSILLLFHNEFNKFNNTGARILDSIYLFYLLIICRELFKTCRAFCRDFSSTSSTNRASDMSAPVLLNLLNELEKSDKMRGLPSTFLLFRKKVK